MGTLKAYQNPRINAAMDSLYAATYHITRQRQIAFENGSHDIAGAFALVQQLVYEAGDELRLLDRQLLSAAPDATDNGNRPSPSGCDTATEQTPWQHMMAVSDFVNRQNGQ